VTQIRIATRQSPLALKQVEIFQQALEKTFPKQFSFEIIKIKTKGDKLRDVPLNEIGGKALFVKEIEEALLENRADVGVHSLKDMSTELPSELVIGCVLPREDPRDVWISRDHHTIFDLPSGSRVGTSSLRRASQVLHARPDLKVIPFRGNVGTRLTKIEMGEADATLLAHAGVKRLNMTLGKLLSVHDFLPAVSQGALSVELRQHDADLLEIMKSINHKQTEICVRAEREFLRTLDGSCRTPIAAYAIQQGNHLHLDGLLASEDGKKLVRMQDSGCLSDPEALGRRLALLVKERFETI